MITAQRAVLAALFCASLQLAVFFPFTTWIIALRWTENGILEFVEGLGSFKPVAQKSCDLTAFSTKIPAIKT
jgi:hypothetical protein